MHAVQWQSLTLSLFALFAVGTCKSNTKAAEQSTTIDSYRPYVSSVVSPFCITSLEFAFSVVEKLMKQKLTKLVVSQWLVVSAVVEWPVC